MTFKSRLLSGTAAALLALAATAAVAQDAAATGPNGEPLAENQTFTYRVLDEFPSIDPNLIEDVEGSHIGRNLFEGLMSQDDRGQRGARASRPTTTSPTTA